MEESGSLPIPPAMATMKWAETESPALLADTAALHLYPKKSGKMLRNLYSLEIIHS